jgi:hypothetical protein
MARLFIPQVGNQLKLIANWDCKIFNDRLNKKVFSGLNIDVTGEDSRNSTVDITFPKGTVLKVDRLYVRAPASSYDSITFSIASCPIKSLVKARFWVKLMDANKIEFEEIIEDMDSHEKLKNLYRYVALKNEFKNSEHLNETDAVFVSKEIFEHYSKKNNNVLTAKIKLSAEEFLDTVAFEGRRHYSYDRNQLAKLREEALAKVKTLFDEIEVTSHILPVLDGLVYHIEENTQSIEADKALDLYGKEAKDYWDTTLLGSYLSRNKYNVLLDKGEMLNLINKKMWNDKLETVHFEYQGKPQSFKNEKELNKFIKSIRVVIPKKK